MIVELLDHAVAPRFSGRDEPDLDLMMQTQPNQAAHSSGMGGAAVEDGLVVHLVVTGRTQAKPRPPDGVEGVLASPAENGLDPTASRRYVHSVQAVEAGRSGQVPGSHVVRLVNRSRSGGNQGRILLWEKGTRYAPRDRESLGRIVQDVLAEETVNDVLALISYALRRRSCSSF